MNLISSERFQALLKVLPKSELDRLGPMFDNAHAAEERGDAAEAARLRADLAEWIEVLVTTAEEVKLLSPEERCQSLFSDIDALGAPDTQRLARAALDDIEAQLRATPGLTQESIECVDALHALDQGRCTIAEAETLVYMLVRRARQKGGEFSNAVESRI